MFLYLELYFQKLYTNAEGFRLYKHVSETRKTAKSQCNQLIKFDFRQPLCKFLPFVEFNYFGMTTVRFLSKLLASLMRNYFPKRAAGTPLHTLSILYNVPVGFVSPPLF